MKRVKGCFRRLAIGCLGIIAVSLAIGVILNIVDPSNTSVSPEAQNAWVTGVDRCIHSSAYGQIVLPDNINVWSGWGDNRNQIVGQVSHGQPVQILEARQDKSMTDDRVYYKIKTEGGLMGWLGRDYIQFTNPSEGFEPIEDC